jgi:pyruvate/2-oxoglutarate dehydrogenase complex dihydrolipoamide dehydrogenase (E3) component
VDRKKKPLGIQIMGPHAVELWGEWVAIMNGCGRVCEDFRCPSAKKTLHPSRP